MMVDPHGLSQGADAVASTIQSLWSHRFGPESWLLLTASRGLCLTLYGLAVMRCARYGRWWNLVAVLLFALYFVGATVDSTWDRPRERQVLTVGLAVMNIGHIVLAIGRSTPRRKKVSSEAGKVPGKAGREQRVERHREGKAVQG